MKKAEFQKACRQRLTFSDVLAAFEFEGARRELAENGSSPAAPGGKKGKAAADRARQIASADLFSAEGPYYIEEPGKILKLISSIDKLLTDVPELINKAFRRGYLTSYHHKGKDRRVLPLNHHRTAALIFLSLGKSVKRRS